jgi:exodeoxyribonuclease VII large subunit
MADARALSLFPEEGARPAWTVGELTAAVRARLEGAPELRDFRVSGEISNFKHHTSGHMYFTLKDEQAVLRCVMFRARASLLPFRPANGMQVLLRGQIGVFERDGAYQCYGREMVPAGLGSLHLAFEQLKARLSAAGLFRDEDKRSLPRLPRRVALVTSPSGAALRDMVRVARRRCPGVELVLVPVLVQGVDAPGDIVRGLRLAGAAGCDVVILARGGGSLEELWAFNDEAVARAIRACPVPVVTGVGHETDHTIADFAADRRAPTPSAAAEVVVPDREALRADLFARRRAMERTLVSRLGDARMRLRSLAGRGPLSRPAAAFSGHRLRLGHAAVRLARAGTARGAAARAAWEAAGGRLHALSPLAVLGRGFAVCRTGDGRVVRRAAEAPPGARVEVLLQVGALLASVTAHGPGIDIGGPGDGGA